MSSLGALSRRLTERTDSLSEVRGILSEMLSVFKAGSACTSDVDEDMKSNACKAVALNLNRYAEDAVVAQSAFSIFNLVCDDGVLGASAHMSGLTPAEPLSVLRYHEDEDTAVSAMRMVMALADRSLVFKSMLLSRAAVADVVTAVKRHRGSLTFLKVACCVLHRMSVLEVTAKALIKAGGHEAVFSAVAAHASDATVAEQSANFIGNVAPHLPGPDAERAVAVLVAALRAQPESQAVAFSVFKAVIMLAHASPVTSTKIVAAGHAFPLVDAMRRQEASAEVAEAGCVLVGVLAKEPVSHTRLVVAGAGAALAAALRLHEAVPDIVSSAARAVVILANEAGRDMANQMLLQDEGIVPLLVAALRRHVRTGSGESFTSAKRSRGLRRRTPACSCEQQAQCLCLCRFCRRALAMPTWCRPPSAA